MTSYDLTVRGAGVFGLSIAWVASCAGAKVQVIDPNGAASGSSGGVVGALAPHAPEKWNAKKQFQLESLLMAEKFWAEVAQAGGGTPGYARNGRLQPVQKDSALALARQRGVTAEHHWQDHAIWEVTQETPAGWAPDSPTGYYIHDTLSALLHPRDACAALVLALRSKGTQVIPTGDDQGPVIWATGVAGLTEMTDAHHRLVGNGVKGQAALLDVDARGLPQLFVDGLHIIPHSNGTVAVGSTSERLFASPDQTDDQLDRLIALAGCALPALQNAPVLERWAGVRPRARTRAPMLGPWPDRPGHFIANGGFKIGFGVAPKIAHVMTELVLNGQDTIPDGFRVQDNL